MTYDQLYAAFTADVPVVSADFAVTTYCDCDACAACWPSGAGPLSAAPSSAWRPAGQPGPPVLQVTVLDRQFRLCPAAARAVAAPRLPAPAPRAPDYQASPGRR